MNFHRIEDSSIIKSLDTCIKKRLDLLITMSNAEGLIKAEGNDLAEKRNDLEEGNDPKKLEQIIELYKGSEVLIKEFDEFNKALTTVAEGKSSSLLSIVAVRQYLIDQKITHLLYATIPSGGGETITKKRVLSLSSGDTRFLGGGVVSYVLSDTKGKIIAANTLIEMTAIRYDLDQKGPLKFSD
jgi:hypothetical protein